MQAMFVFEIKISNLKQKLISKHLTDMTKILLQLSDQLIFVIIM